MDFIQTIGQSKLFKGLSVVQLEQLEQISELRHYQKGDMLFHEGMEGNGFYVIARGQIKVFKLSFEGREQILHILGFGDPLGEVPVFAGETFPANAQALSKASLYFFPRAKLLNLYENNPALAMNMLAILSRRLREFTVLIENLSLKEIPQRLATYLVHQQAQSPTSASIKLQVSKGVLSNILGASQETLSRVLARMTQEGLIQVQGKEIGLLNLQQLQDLADGEIKL